MASKIKVTVSVDERLLLEVAGRARGQGRSRSQVVEDALRLWRRRQLEQALREGYLAMAKEDRTAAERRLGAAWEAIR